MLVDLLRCTGCDTCTLACKQENDLPEGNSWVRVQTIGGPYPDDPLGKYPELKIDWRPVFMVDCDFCEKRIEKGFAPFCVDNCYTDALIFGNLDDPQSEISLKMEDLEKQGRVILKDGGRITSHEHIYYAYY